MIHLRPYQQTSVDDIRAAFRRTRRVLLVSPTGSGKTVMFSYIGKSMFASGKRVYILVHRAELLEQVCRTLDAFDVPHGVIAAGHSPRSCPVQVASVFTLANRLKNYPKPDLLIVDEAHHACGGSTWARVFAFWQGVFVLGVTATPIRLDGKSLAGSFDELVLGPTVADLMDSGDLSSYKLYVPPHVLGKMRVRCGDYVHEDANREMNKPKLIGDAVDHYARLGQRRRAIAFCVSLDHAAATERAFTERGFRAARIDGQMDRADRKRLVQGFTRGDLDVLTSCELVSEGFDVPAAKCALLMRPTMSMGLSKQQVGRVLRPEGGLEAIIFDHAGNSLKHGLPDDDVEWSLDEETNGKRRKAVAGAVRLRLCGKCYAACKSGTMECPECGWLFPVASRAIKAEDGELVEATGVAPKRRTLESINKAREVGMATTFEELKRIADERGYREGWVTAIMRAKAEKARGA
jgi:superfamily II DNA or RNA helicase